jgi:hypothetical protein
MWRLEALSFPLQLVFLGRHQTHERFTAVIKSYKSYKSYLSYNL